MQKLKIEQVRKIKKMIAKGELSMNRIGQKFGVACRTITAIRDGKTWSWMDT